MHQQIPYRMILEQYLNTLSVQQHQQLMTALNIQKVDFETVVAAARQLYWVHLWPSKLSITGDNGKKLLENTNYTGLSLIDSVNARNPSLVLDVGCGQNFYKNKIKNLIGIDVFGNNCDLNYDYFVSDRRIIADVILVLGVLEYGSPDQAHQRLVRILQDCRPTTEVFFRFNISSTYRNEIMPGLDICYFMNKRVYSPSQWNHAVEQAGFRVIFSDWDTVDQRWHVRATPA